MMRFEYELIPKMTSVSASQPVQINFRTASFLMSAQTLKQCPADTGVEIAFAGRSNAGKSSALNRLTGQTKLARTSKTPGRTQLINFFGIDPKSEKRLVDLPGYGYAKVPLAIKKEWEKNLTDYLHNRNSLRGCLLLMDVRRPLQEFDQNFVQWADASGLPIHALLTKSDKLKRGAAKNALLGLSKQIGTLGLNQKFSAQLFSSLNGQGLPELENKLSAWFEDEAKD